MRRRELIAGTGFAAASALAGCLGGNKSPPPRKSNVVSNVEATDGKLRIALEDSTWVMSRYDAGGSQSLSDPDLGGLAPVGGARAKGKGGSGGRGATGRASGGYSSAPKTRHGRAWYHGGAYADDWYDDHRDEVTKFPVAVAAVAVGYVGSDFQMRDDPPEPGPISWDCKRRNPEDVETCPLARDGWYRVGAHVVGENVDHDFRWECIDCKVDDSTTGGMEVEREWKVSPRI